MPKAEGFWRMTGKVRVRAGWFGLCVVEVEEITDVCHRLPGEGYSPGQWSTITRWRRLRRGERLLIARGR